MIQRWREFARSHPAVEEGGKSNPRGWWAGGGGGGGGGGGTHLWRASVL